MIEPGCGHIDCLYRCGGDYTWETCPHAQQKHGPGGPMTPPTEERRAELRAKAEALIDADCAYYLQTQLSPGKPSLAEYRAREQAERDFDEVVTAETVIELLDHITALEAALRPFAGFDIVSMAGDCECYVAAYGPNGEKLGDHVMSTADFRRAASLLPGEGNA